MPLLKPNINNQITEYPQDTLDAASAALGLLRPQIDEVGEKSESERLRKARKIFTDAGLDVQNAALAIREVMRFGETDTGKLKAAELALRVQGITEEIDVKQIPEIRINIISNGGNTIVNLVTPAAGGQF